jgi:ParB/RepB/Spo0J family partition protein
MSLRTMKKSEIYFEPNFNRRGEVNPIVVAELAKDIAGRGLLQPIVVEEIFEGDLFDQGFRARIIAGFRRACACFDVLGWTEIDCSVQKPMTALERALINITENVQREDFTYLEETRAIKYIFDMGFNEHQVEQMLNVKRGWIQPRAQFLKLPEYVQRNADKVPKGWAQYGRDLYTIMHNQGTHECVKAFDFLVITKQNNPDAAVSLKQFIGKTKMNSLTKPPREKMKTKQELIAMNSRIMRKMDDDSQYNIIPRIIAWCMGSVSEEDLVAELNEIGVEVAEAEI